MKGSVKLMPILITILIGLILMLVLVAQGLTKEGHEKDETIATLMNDNSILSTNNLTLQWTLERERVVIEKLEELKGVAVSSVTYYAPTGNRTATGTHPVPGRTVAVDPNLIPLGSEVWVEGSGWHKAEDTGGAIDGTDVDVFVESEDEARRGGRDSLRILWRESE